MEAYKPTEEERLRDFPWLPPGATLARASGITPGESLHDEYTAKPEQVRKFIQTLQQLDRAILDAAGEDHDIRL